ncbi:OpgC domain-containing protein [Salinisphaera sp. Q1T1-3]|uniref:OpgC domain-containing protein n=1 Tax=Salinisphaera sp. Q1T1-3 TaxID=2321229 RepID=UPI002101CEE5|nr:OpgC domain-containing protein [Salinisphaera sp. Q1T1-3]
MTWARARSAGRDISAAASPTTAAARSGRDARVDSLRGLLLVIMTLDHLGGPLYAITYSPLGYVTAAEGFVFLSGYMFALAYALRAPSMPVLLTKSLRRAGLIYRYHVALLALLVGLTWLMPRLAAYWHLGGASDHPVTWPLLSIALINQPSYFDILPMYVIFVLTTPLAALGFARGRGHIVLLVSVGIWALGSLVNPTASLTAQLDGDFRPGHFNLLCWQLLWVAGLALGYYREPVKRLIARLSPALWLALILFLGAIFLARHGIVTLGVSAAAPAVDSTHMGWLRMLDTLGLLLLTGGMLSYVRRDARIGWLAYLGRASIQVFAFQIVLVYLDMGIGFRITALGGPGLYIVYSLLCVMSLTVPAFLHHRRL